MKIDVTKIIGYILLSPALVSVVMFIAPAVNFTTEEKKFFFDIVPQTYFGLMAIAGAYLIKDKK